MANGRASICEAAIDDSRPEESAYRIDFDEGDEDTH